MKADHIIWDFDGTLYPLDPYDSEAMLLLLAMDHPQGIRSPLRRCAARCLMKADQLMLFKGYILRKIYNVLYAWCLCGISVNLLDDAALVIANRISSEDRTALKELADRGYHMSVLSCGTADLCERVLKLANIHSCFTAVTGNRFTFAAGRICGFSDEMLTAGDKLNWAKGHIPSAEQCIAVGDGYTDMPLLEWAGIGIMITRNQSTPVRYRSRPYRVVSSISNISLALPDLVEPYHCK